MGEDNGTDNFDFLVQGWYDNAIMAHPFDKNKVYVAGVNIWEFTATDLKKLIRSLILKIAVRKPSWNLLIFQEVIWGVFWKLGK